MGLKEKISDDLDSVLGFAGAVKKAIFACPHCQGEGALPDGRYCVCDAGRKLHEEDQKKAAEAGAARPVLASRPVRALPGGKK